MIQKSFIWFLLLVIPFVSLSAQYDVLIVGGGASGVTAGIQSARMGAKTIIVEETPWLGGMLTAAGVSAIDGNHQLHGGLWGEFHDELVKYYGSTKALETGWVSKVLFEPSVGNKILKQLVSKEKNLKVMNSCSLVKIAKQKGVWTATIQNGKKRQTIKAKVVVDATELGDVAAGLGVKYDIGMDARSKSGEDIAPEESNNVVQDLTYVMVLKMYDKDMTIAKPASYNPADFYCSTKSDKCTSPKPGQTLWAKESMINYGKLPNNKYMINWPIDGNDYYTNIINLTDKERKKELQKAKEFSKCFLYYLQTELGFSQLGLADDEFPTTDKFPFIAYHRESRRIDGKVRFTVNDAARPYENREKPIYRTGIAVGDYPIDHHHKRHPEWEKLPELHFYKIPSYSVPLGSLVPKNIEGLIVAEKSISVSNLLNGSTRLQPVVMQIGSAAGALAALSAKANSEVRNVAVRDVQTAILEANGYLLPYLDVPVNHKAFKAYQRIGATGILKGVGKNVGWSNQTWFQADSLLQVEELRKGLEDFKYTTQFKSKGAFMTVAESFALIQELVPTTQLGREFQQWNQLGLTNFDLNREIKRGEFAILFDAIVHPFEKQGVDYNGNWIK